MRLLGSTGFRSQVRGDLPEATWLKGTPGEFTSHEWCHGWNASVPRPPSPPDSSVEALVPSVMVCGGGPLGSR